MRVFNVKRTQELKMEDLDLQNGCLICSTMRTTTEDGRVVTERIFIYHSNVYAKRSREIIAEVRLLKRRLKDTDYKAIKFAEGELTAAEYCETKNQRKVWRDRIRELEAEKEALEM